MPVSAMATNATQSNPMGTLAPLAPMPGAPSGSAQNPTVMPPSFQFQPTGPTGANYADIIGQLSKTPQSQTNMVMPYLQSLFGQQDSMAQRVFANQGAQGASQAQSNAMARGLTGSSIEAASMGAAYNAANAGYDQFMMNALQNLGQSYMNMAGFDIGQQNQQSMNLASAMGSQMTNEQEQANFERMFREGMSQAGQNRLAGQQGALINGAFSLAGNGLRAIAMSDIRLKKNIQKIGKALGLDVFSFEYDSEGKEHLRLPDGKHVGFMAHHVADKYPEAVSVDRGYLCIDYSKLPLVA